MSQDPKSQKKKPTLNKPATSQQSRRSGTRSVQAFPLLFSKQTYIYMGIGCALIAIGMLLMLGGDMKDPNVWDETVIYSFRRITLAPIVILSGLGVQIYAIFKK